MSTKIYIVEDHPVMQQVLSEYITELDQMEVCGIAPTAETALAELPQAEADLVIVDLSLPQMSGDELVKEIREQWPDLPCVILSGHGESGYVRRALAAGAQGYVLKGDPHEIESAIDNVLRGRVFLSKSLEYE